MTACQVISGSRYEMCIKETEIGYDVVVQSFSVLPQVYKKLFKDRDEAITEAFKVWATWTKQAIDLESTYDAIHPVRAIFYDGTNFDELKDFIDGTLWNAVGGYVTISGAMSSIDLFREEWLVIDELGYMNAYTDDQFRTLYRPRMGDEHSR